MSTNTRNLRARYDAVGSWTTSTRSLTQTVNKAITTTLLSSSVNPSVSGQTVTLTAAVSVNAPGSTAVANPTGTVNFFDGFAPLGPGTLSTTGGVDQATFRTSTLSNSSDSQITR